MLAVGRGQAEGKYAAARGTRYWIALACCVCFVGVGGNAPLVAREHAPLPKIEVAPLADERQTIELSSECEDIVASAGGRYLILWFLSERKLSVFDVSAAKFIKDIPIASDKIVYTAGADCLIVALLDQKLIQHWDLANFERTATVPFPENVNIKNIVLGCASTGPAGIVAREFPSMHFAFLDTNTLNTIEILHSIIDTK